MEITTSFTKETQKLAFELAKKIKPGDVLALYGDLGSGKTTFTSYLVSALGIESRVQSPSFVIIRKYSNADVSKSNIKTVYHIDLYRLTKKEELEDLGLEELFYEENAVSIIEWPELAEDLLPEGVITMKFEYLDENIRKINVQNID